MARRGYSRRIFPPATAAHTRHDLEAHMTDTAPGISERPGGNPGIAAELPSPEVAEFIRYCHRRRRAGWPEIYDDMCAVAARREFRDLDHAKLSELGVSFSLFDTPRLAAWVRALLPRDAASAPPNDGLSPAQLQDELGTGSEHRAAAIAR